MTSLRVVVQNELRPDHHMSDVQINGVWPVVVEDLVVCLVAERSVARRVDFRPIKTLMLQEVKYRAITPLQIVTVSQVFSEVTRHSMELVNAVGIFHADTISSCSAFDV